ncbi:hypothetical protein ABT154_21510 [Streptomyces sp. NPDC001728]|uniref:hypothetical protein n=1 Tax=Streptomyces sp. NPDC001728 TaxID=3154396 RepID=UPI00332B3E6F
MDKHQRRARAIRLRQENPLPHRRLGNLHEKILPDLDAIDAATTDPVVRAATARIRATLGPRPDTPCAATQPDSAGGAPYTCSHTIHIDGSPHFDEQRQVHWLPTQETR